MNFEDLLPLLGATTTNAQRAAIKRADMAYEAGLIDAMGRAAGVKLCKLPDCGCDGLEHP